MIVKKWIAFWIWKHLAGGRVPFYQARKLRKHRTYHEPQATAWFGWKLELWNRAVEYLKSTGGLTFTPTLREKF